MRGFSEYTVKLLTAREAKLRHLFCQLNTQSHLEYNIAQERRRQLKEHHGRLIQEEVEKMERDLAQEQLPVR